MHIIAMKLFWRYLNLVDGQNCQAAKLKSLPNKLCICYNVGKLKFGIQA